MSEAPKPGSYIQVARVRSGDFAVATYDCVSPGLYKLTGRWFGKSEGMAMLHAQRMAAVGYILKNGGRP